MGGLDSTIAAARRSRRPPPPPHRPRARPASRQSSTRSQPASAPSAIAWTLAQLSTLPAPAPRPADAAPGSVEAIVLDALDRHGPMSAYAMHRLLWVFDVRQVRNALHRLQLKGVLDVTYEQVPSAVGRVIRSIYRRKHPR